ncbi:hypothetical protein [Lutispora sp.]|uniref:hypothetical protein n=1 Tax=Lutispora sp. TaxID=2828727 RepID=UPI002B21B3D1|nr:hypothetical protein [Lutispora sp.]MEA4960551.1 hypothetical protein [Lutispora sp.]
MEDRNYILVIAFIASAIAVLRDLYLRRILEKHQSHLIASSLLMLIVMSFLLIVKLQDKNYTIIIGLVVLGHWIYALYKYKHMKLPY